MNPKRSANMFAVDGRETWLIHNYLRDDETDFDAIDADWCIRTIMGVDADFPYDVITRENWIGRRLLADRFRDRRVFICGDAAHLWVPSAGYGMNAGIADAMNLSWMLAGVLHGWADPGHPRRARGGALADHRTSLEIRDEHVAGGRADAGRSAGRHRKQRRSPGRAWPAHAGDAHAAILLRRPELRIRSTTVRRSSRTTARPRRPTRWTSSRRRRFPVAERRISGSTMGGRCMMRWARIIACCGSIVPSTCAD